MDSTKIERPPGIVRAPLVPSHRNGSSSASSAAAVAAARKPKTREIASRYKSSTSTSGRCASPTANPRVGVVTAQPPPRRSQSAERRRPATPSKCTSSSSPSSRPLTPSSTSSRSSTPTRDSTINSSHTSRRLFGLRSNDGLWPSMRSLSASFQSESVSIPTTIATSKHEKVRKNPASSDPKSKPSATSNTLSERKRTPLRGKNRNSSENSKPLPSERPVDHQRWPGGILGAKFSGANMSRSVDLTPSMSKPRQGVSPRRVVPVSDSQSRFLPHKSISDGNSRRFSLDGIRQVQGQAQVPDDGKKGNPSVVLPERSASSSNRPARSTSMPVTGAVRSSSPIRFPMPSAVSSSKVSASPTRTRTPSPLPATGGRSGGIASSVLSYICDVRKGKKNWNHVEDAHQLRLLHNRYLQWRFVNARLEATLSIQKMMTENMLYNVWATITELHDSVADKKVTIQRLKQEMQLQVILKEQVIYLEDWASLEREHSSSLSGAIEALKASTVRLPVTGGARADFHALKDIIGSAVDVMRLMGSSVCHLLSRVEGTNSLVAELLDAAAKERTMLRECRELLALTAALQVQESSLRTHLLQLRQDMLNVG